MSDALLDRRSSSCRAIPLPDHEWERLKPIIESEYKSRTLKDLRAFMDNKYQFRATPQQYKGRLRLWKVDKYIKRAEMDRLVQDPALEQASNGRFVTLAQKQRHLRRMSARASLSPANQSEALSSDARSPASQVPTPTDDSLMSSEQANHNTVETSFHNRPVQLVSIHENAVSSNLIPSPERFHKASAIQGLSPTLSNFYSRLYQGFDIIKQQNASEIMLINQMNVCRWTKLHFAILWHLIIDAWPSAISHARYPIDEKSWKWFFETDLNLDDVFGYTQTVPDTFAEHHAMILAALFTVRFWSKSSAETASVRSHSKPFCVALAILATKRAVSCLYDGPSTRSRYHDDCTEEALSGLATDQECAAVHSGLMKTIQCDLKANKFALWEDDIFQFIDYLRCKMKICAPTLRSSDACDVLQKYLPSPEYARFGDLGAYPVQSTNGFMT